MDDKLERYKGELSREQLITARNKIVENAKNLLCEAQLLYNNQRYSRTYFLLCICNEELGKSVIITSAIVELVKGSINWKRFWRHLRNHKDKTGTIEHMENIFISSDENFTDPNNIQKILPHLEEIKMASLYSDMFQNDFFDPDEIIPCELVESFLKLTSNRIESMAQAMPSDDTLKSFTKKDFFQFQEMLGLKTTIPNQTTLSDTKK